MMNFSVIMDLGLKLKKIREQFKNSDIKGMIESVPNEMVDVFAIAGIETCVKFDKKIFWNC